MKDPLVFRCFANDVDLRSHNGKVSGLQGTDKGEKLV
jgi:hypothetical protein